MFESLNVKKRVGSLRITTGQYKGRVIRMPKGIRPTQDKVRKAIFDILGDIEGLSFLELFAGSGAVGFEAASRGVKDLILVEYNQDCRLAINKNIESLKLRACTLYPKEVEVAIKQFHRDGRNFDIIFLDPPYYQGLSKKTLQTLSLYDILAPVGLIVVQHFKKDILPDTQGELTLFKQSTYGDTLLSFYRKRES
ncbi:MAG: 16S rRNA (guanine(966)-N(2))-methyltransferase RsmD [Candidatus Omnitrophica bacterium]|nr:16S rRNA (guanine(966)-N(2))-methyltransferase RsmD [Candidatus Omnitrophota bacterium]MDD5592822.1 16S rRNA (guanine(966)-N(2))-methyltransferase RsmD [Candidatus Omnitrophota bacterium]